MPDWGGIGGMNFAGGLLNGLAQGYEHASRMKRQEALIQQQRAFQQQDEIFRTLSGLIQENPTLATNPAFLNMIPASGIDEERGQVLSFLTQAIAADPGVQRAQDQKEFLAQLGDQVRAKYGAGAGPPAALSDMTATEAALVGGGALSQAVAADRKGSGKTAQPSVRYTKIPQGNEVITRKTVIQDGQIMETDVGRANAAAGRAPKRPTGKQQDLFDRGNTVLQTIDEIEALATDPKDPRFRNILGTTGTVIKELGADWTPKALRDRLLNYGYDEEQADFASTVARLANEDTQKFYGAALTGGEQTRAIRQTPSLTLPLPQFLGKLKQARKYTKRGLVNLQKRMRKAGAEEIPELETEPSPVAPGATVPADDAALNAAFLGQ